MCREVLFIFDVGLSLTWAYHYYIYTKHWWMFDVGLSFYQIDNLVLFCNISM